MKKLVILAVALLIVPASAMAGMTAFMNMDELSSKEMATVTGQTGITIDMNTAITSGIINWVDADGAATGLYSTQGALVIELGSITTGIASLTVDAGTGPGGSALVITTTSPVLNADITAIRCATAADLTLVGPSLGEIKITSLVAGSTQIAIYGH